MMILWLIISGAWLLGWGYFTFRLSQDSADIVDFQSNYHRTMDPQQIILSRRAFFRSECRKNPRLRHLNRWRQLGKGLLWLGGIAGSLQLIRWVMVATHPEWWFAATGVVVMIGWGLFAGCTWVSNRQLYRLTTPVAGVEHVALTVTPVQPAQHFLRHQLGSLLSLMGIFMMLIIGSLTGIIKVGYQPKPNQQAIISHGLVIGTQTPPTVSTTAPQSNEHHHSAASVKDDSSTTTLPKWQRVAKDPAYVRSLAIKRQAYLTTQDQVGLFSMYYLALTNSPADGMENNPGVRYTFHRIKNYHPVTIVVKSNETRPFIYLAQISGSGPVEQRTVRLFRFTGQTPSQLHGLVPPFVPYPNSAVKIGRLINAYYSEQDGAYHRTMWAMAPGTAWQY